MAADFYSCSCSSHPLILRDVSTRATHKLRFVYRPLLIHTWQIGSIHQIKLYQYFPNNPPRVHARVCLCDEVLFPAFREAAVSDFLALRCADVIIKWMPIYMSDNELASSSTRLSRETSSDLTISAKACLPQHLEGSCGLASELLHNAHKLSADADIQLCLIDRCDAMEDL